MSEYNQKQINTPRPSFIPKDNNKNRQKQKLPLVRYIRPQFKILHRYRIIIKINNLDRNAKQHQHENWVQSVFNLIALLE